MSEKPLRMAIISKIEKILSGRLYGKRIWRDILQELNYYY